MLFENVFVYERSRVNHLRDDGELGVARVGGEVGVGGAADEQHQHRPERLAPPAHELARRHREHSVAREGPALALVALEGLLDAALDVLELVLDEAVRIGPRRGRGVDVDRFCCQHGGRSRRCPRSGLRKLWPDVLLLLEERPSALQAGTEGGRAQHQDSEHRAEPPGDARCRLRS